MRCHVGTGATMSRWAPTPGAAIPLAVASVAPGRRPSGIATAAAWPSSRSSKERTRVRRKQGLTSNASGSDGCPRPVNSVMERIG